MHVVLWGLCLAVKDFDQVVSIHRRPFKHHLIWPYEDKLISVLIDRWQNCVVHLKAIRLREAVRATLDDESVLQISLGAA